MTRRRPIMKKQGSFYPNQGGIGQGGIGQGGSSQGGGDQTLVSDNAFASAVTEQQYDVEEEDDARRFLSEAIEMHATTIKHGETDLDLGELDELEGGGDMAPVSSGPVSDPPPRSFAAAIGNRIFSSFARKESDNEPVPVKKHTGVLQQDDVSVRSSVSKSTVRSSLSMSGRFDVKKIEPNGVIYPYQTRNARAARIAVATACFVSSLIFSFSGGGGKIGLSLASNYYSSSIATGNSHLFSQSNQDYQNPSAPRIPDQQNSQNTVTTRSYESVNTVSGTNARAFVPSLAEIPKPSTKEEEEEEAELFTDENLETMANLPAMNIDISPKLTNNLADISSPIPSPKTETAIFWEIPKSGSSVIRIALSECIGTVEAHDLAGPNDDMEIKVMQSMYGIQYVNVDTTTLDGIERAKSLQFATTSLADVAYTPYLKELVDIFNPQFRARIFALFRDPVDRTMSLYHQQQRDDEEVAEMSIVDYIRSNKYIDNFMTRALTRKHHEKLTDDDLLQAMEFTRKYIVVGLSEEIDESITKFTDHFGWKTRMDQEKYSCLESLSHRVNIGPYGVHKGTVQWDWVHSVNKFDYQLYLYARYIFTKQTVTGAN